MSGATVSDGVFIDGYDAPFARGTGDVTSSFFAPENSSLFALSVRAEAGATVEWGVDHGDEAIYVVDGSLWVDDTVLGPGGAVIVEAGVRANLDVAIASTLLHLGPQSGRAITTGPFGAPEPGCQVHVIPSTDTDHRTSTLHPLDVRYFADSGCPTCRISLFGVGHTEPYKAGAHQHSEDEIITVLRGEFMVGPTRVPPGHSVAVPANTMYGYQALSAYRFVNYRPNASFVTTHGQEPKLESGPVRS